MRNPPAPGSIQHLKAEPRSIHTLAPESPARAAIADNWATANSYGLDRPPHQAATTSACVVDVDSARSSNAGVMASRIRHLASRMPENCRRVAGGEKLR
jgi:hypothetical protein